MWAAALLVLYQRLSGIHQLVFLNRAFTNVNLYHSKAIEALKKLVAMPSILNPFHQCRTREAENCFNGPAGTMCCTFFLAGMVQFLKFITHCPYTRPFLSPLPSVEGGEMEGLWRNITLRVGSLLRVLKRRDTERYQK